MLSDVSPAAFWIAYWKPQRHHYIRRYLPHEAKTEGLRALEPQQSQRVHRHQHGCAGIGENGRPEAGNADNRGDEEHRIKAESDGDILMDVAHSAP